jgi:hypothetical protein
MIIWLERHNTEQHMILVLHGAFPLERLMSLYSEQGLCNIGCIQLKTKQLVQHIPMQQEQLSDLPFRQHLIRQTGITGRVTLKILG